MQHWSEGNHTTKAAKHTVTFNTDKISIEDIIAVAKITRTLRKTTLQKQRQHPQATSTGIFVRFKTFKPCSCITLMLVHPNVLVVSSPLKSVFVSKQQHI